MTDISLLLKEAKPLYLKRKKRRRMITNVAVGVTMCSLLTGLMFHQITPTVYQTGLNELYVCLYDNQSYESATQLMSQEDDFFPVDEYGLILVNA